MVVKNNSKDIKRQLKREIKRGFTASNKLVADTAKRLAPVDKGQLVGSIDSRMTSGLSSEIGTILDYGLYQERGTGIYSLDPNGRKTPWVYPVLGQRDNKGRQLFRRTQGTRPKQFIERSFEMNKNHIPRLFEKYLQNVGK